MIVCVCNNVSEGRIHQAVRDGATSMAELRNDLGVANNCGKCHSCAKQVLKECLSQGAAVHHHSIQVISFTRNSLPV
ncbi:(2Fe-2S)-binding protein [Oxalobacteraceae bacterium CAVE-383]|nr:(2Fe-2S)-binding protein [Oxalobacteraceae bacterium CAVE-383]